MKEKSDFARKPKIARGHELVFPVMALVFAIYYLSTIMDLTWEAQINGVLIGSILILLVLFFLAKVAWEVFRGVAVLSFDVLTQPGRIQLTRIGVLLLGIAYVIVIQWAGFTLTTFGFLIAAMLLLGVRSPFRLILISLIFSSAGYYFFIELLETRLPPGPIERLIDWLI